MNEFFNSQVPYAASLTLNATVRDMRKVIVGSTYPKAFQMRNKAFPKALFRMKFSRKHDLEVVLYDRLNKPYMQTHATGGVKTPRGRHIAIPVGVSRTSTGRVPKAKQPRVVLDRKDTFVMDAKGTKLIVQRPRKKGAKLKALYVLAPKAKIGRSFRFYEEAAAVADRVIDGHWNTSLARAARSARIFSG